MIASKLTSSLEKCFPDMSTSWYPELNYISALKNEEVSFQLIYKADGAEPHRSFASVKIEGIKNELCEIRTVECIPSSLPCYPNAHDDNFLRTATGLYPDLLLPLGNNGQIPVVCNELRSAFITIRLDGSATGRLPIKLLLIGGDKILAEHSLLIDIKNAELPPQKLKVTQWFHGDCLASYYNCPVFSEKWWKIVENFVASAARNGINTLLTPIFTPPLDTEIGGERPTVQLVDVLCENGNYTFNFDKLDRWIKMCDRNEIKYFEISHFFTQWGAAHAPKIMATVNGEYKRIFGWETDAAGNEYKAFLRGFIPELIAHMSKRGDDKRCLFHISDEPNANNLEQYEKSRNTVIDLLQGYTVMDALSNFEFYEKGIVTTPIPSNDHIAPFLNANIKGLWTYYCCGQSKNNVSNRFFAMPSWRTRSIGTQFFKYDIEGFLQWGFNFYYSQFSRSFVNPYLDSTGNYFVPSGDTYSVYPSPDGHAYDSLRIVAFKEALNDLSACELCASLIGKEETVKLLESVLGNIAFDNCARAAAPVLTARKLINDRIEKELEKTTIAIG